mmetsp:Transcript_21093/g.48796  ORF Transcript_21093/g.48796 Transcript_21093/m.48796 type:complete len:364 (-) Transcript_21093:2148-3239(-)
MIRGKRKMLTFEDLKNSFSLLKETSFFSNHMLFYKKLKQKYNFLYEISKKKKKTFGEKSFYYRDFSFVKQTWITFDLKKSKVYSKNKIESDFFKRKRNYFGGKFFSLSLMPKKLRYFYKYFITVFEKGSQKEQLACLESLSEDDGLFSIIPYIIIYINQIFMAKNQNVLKLKYGIKIIYALIWKNYHKMQPFIHQIFPILINCIIGKRFSGIKEDEQYLKYFSVKIVSLIFFRFGSSYSGLKSKITFLFSKQLLNSLKNIKYLIGPLMGLTSFGTKTVELYVMPFLSIILEQIEKEIFIKKNISQDLKILFDFIINIITSYLIQKKMQFFLDSSLDISSKFKIEEVFKMFPRIEYLKEKLKTQ